MTISEYMNAEYVIKTEDGKAKHFCCSHCALDVQTTERNTVKSARTRDFISGKWMDYARMRFLSMSLAVPVCSSRWNRFLIEVRCRKVPERIFALFFGC
jgi:hypothetical protein